MVSSFCNILHSSEDVLIFIFHLACSSYQCQPAFVTENEIVKHVTRIIEHLRKNHISSKPINCSIFIKIFLNVTKHYLGFLSSQFYNFLMNRNILKSIIFLGIHKLPPRESVWDPMVSFIAEGLHSYDIDPCDMQISSCQLQIITSPLHIQDFSSYSISKTNIAQ